MVAKQLEEQDSKHEAERKELHQLARAADSLKRDNEHLVARVGTLEESNRKRQVQFDALVKAKDDLGMKYSKDTHALKVEIASRV